VFTDANRKYDQYMAWRIFDLWDREYRVAAFRSGRQVLASILAAQMAGSWRRRGAPKERAPLQCPPPLRAPLDDQVRSRGF
jgi:hypothetical protein